MQLVHMPHPLARRERAVRGPACIPLRRNRERRPESGTGGGRDLRFDIVIAKHKLEL